MTCSNAPRSISSVLLDDEARDALLADAEDLLARRVAASRGITGMAVRTGFAAFQRVQPGIVRAALVRLGPRFAPVLDRHWTTALETGDPTASFTMHARTIAADLLLVTDGLAANANSAVLTSIYRSLRGRAEDEVAAAMPDVSGLLERHLG